jgi:hypothetical protein
MDNPQANMPQLPPGLQDKLDQINRLIRDVQRDLERMTPGPADENFSPPWKKPVNQQDLDAVIDFLRERDDPLGGWYSRPGMRISGVEATQSVQFYDLYGQGSLAGSDNSVPLVAGKDLILRAYVERRSEGFAGPVTRFDGVVQYRGKELKSLNGPNPMQDASALRRNLIHDSLNFRIPGADCHGKINFTIKVFDALNPTSVFNRTTYRITTEFVNVPRMRVTGVLYSFTGNSLNLPAPTGMDLVNTLARFLPMLPMQGFDYNVCTIENYDKDLTKKAGWDDLLNNLANLRSASTIRTFYVGLLPANITAQVGSEARGIGRAGLAIAGKDDTRALSHELGHACSIKHVDAGGAPEPFESKYPNYGTFPFGSIGEVGIDTARLTLYNPQFSYDFMSYWENGGVPLFTTNTWISPYHYQRMMSILTASQGTGDIVLQVTITAVAMLFNFRVYRGGRVELLPSYPVRGVPKTRDLRPEVGVMLDLYDRSGAVIGSYRCHQHNPYQDPDGAYLDFHEVLPWSEEVGEVCFVREREELTRLRVGEAPTEVHLEGVRRYENGERDSDLARVEWSAGEVSSENGRTAALVRYSNDGGRTWQAVAADIQENRCLVNLDLLPGGEDCRFEVIVAHGLSAAAVESEPFAVRMKPRQVTIASPENEATFSLGEPVVFAGAGHSPDYGTSPGEDILWSSSQEGNFGRGMYLVRDDLPLGRHRITLTTPDGQAGTHCGEASASVWIKIVEAECQQ